MEVLHFGRLLDYQKKKKKKLLPLAEPLQYAAKDKEIKQNDMDPATNVTFKEIFRVYHQWSICSSQCEKEKKVFS